MRTVHANTRTASVSRGHWKAEPAGRRAGLVGLVGLCVMLGSAAGWHTLAEHHVAAPPPAPVSVDESGERAAAAAEVLAVWAAVEAVGGPELATGVGFDLTEGVQAELDDAFVQADRAGLLGERRPNPFLYHDVRATRSGSGAAVGHARRRLKRVLVQAYRLHAAGCLDVKRQPALDAAVAVQGQVWAEWKLLAALERTAANDLSVTAAACGAIQPALGVSAADARPAAAARLATLRAAVRRFAEQHLPLSRYAAEYDQWADRRLTVHCGPADESPAAGADGAAALLALAKRHPATLGRLPVGEVAAAKLDPAGLAVGPRPAINLRRANEALRADTDPVRQDTLKRGRDAVAVLGR